MRFEISNSDIIWDVASQNDVLIADLIEGTYTTLSGGGACLLWHALINNYNVDEMIELAKSHSNTPVTDMRASIENAISALTSSKILKLSDKTKKTSVEKSVINEKKNPFNVKVLQYNDMDVLLKLDPAIDGEQN